VSPQRNDIPYLNAAAGRDVSKLYHGREPLTQASKEDTECRTPVTLRSRITAHFRVSFGVLGNGHAVLVAPPRHPPVARPTDAPDDLAGVSAAQSNNHSLTAGPFRPSAVASSHYALDRSRVRALGSGARGFVCSAIRAALGASLRTITKPSPARPSARSPGARDLDPLRASVISAFGDSPTPSISSERGNLCLSLSSAVWRERPEFEQSGESFWVHPVGRLLSFEEAVLGDQVHDQVRPAHLVACDEVAYPPFA
jgi:hypothetical protein